MPRNAPSPSVDIQEVAEHLQRLAEQDSPTAVVESALSVIRALHHENASLILEMRRLLRQQSGRRTEKLDPEQLSLMLELVQGDPAEDEASDEHIEDDDEAAADGGSPAPEPGTETRRRPRRGALPKHLPRRTIDYDLGEDERRCPCCDEVMSCIGHDTSEQLAVVPARFEVIEHRRAKYACGQCKETVATAPAPAKVIERGIPHASVLAHISVSKYQDHQPLNRLSAIYARHGVRVPVSTLSGWIAKVADEFEPIVEFLKHKLLLSHVIQTDASGLKVLERDHPEGIHRGTMWCYVGDRKIVLFQYASTAEGRAGPWALLAGRKGYVQADASNTFDRLFDGQVAEAVEAGCLAHARRKFFELKDVDPRVAFPLQLIQKVYAVEREASDTGMTASERLALRQQRSPKHLEKLKRWVVKTARIERPTSPLQKACAYMINHWAALTRFMEDGALSVDNNFCELQIRSLAVGRRNYLFAGSEDGARRAAVLYSVLRTCALHGVEPMAYVADVLAKLAAGWPQARLDELMPDRWQELHASSEPIEIRLPDYLPVTSIDGE
ncbi:MAG: IS66 family transposase [Myxococcales bacterium]|nr:IS66 family transposase [Myxococcales bacterium]